MRYGIIARDLRRMEWDMCDKDEKSTAPEESGIEEGPLVQGMRDHFKKGNDELMEVLGITEDSGEDPFDQLFGDNSENSDEEEKKSD